MDGQITIRAAQPEDAAAVASIINGYAAQDLMLPRSEQAIRRGLSDFVVAEAEGKVVGCGALARLTPDLAEIRSLAVSPDVQGRGLGRQVLLARARQVGYPQVCALTLVPKFFEGLGFHTVDRWAVSPKVWQECVFCPKFHRCDEVAVVYNLAETEADLSMPVAAWEALVSALGRRAILRTEKE